MLGTTCGVNYIMEKFNLGIYGSHNAGVAISLGGKILEVIELERWVGVKNAAFFYVFPVENPIDILNEILDYFETKYGAKEYDYAMYNSWPQEHLDKFRAANTVWVDHHIAHVSNVMYQSDAPEALNISFDGGSDSGHFNIYLTKKGRDPNILYSSTQDVCVPYAALGHYIPEIKREDNFWLGNLTYAGKIMGLSSYGNKNEKLLHIVKRLFDLCQTNEVDKAHEYWNILNGQKLETGQDGRDLAWAAQKNFELTFAKVALPYILEHQDKKLQFSGGGSMNILNNSLYKSFVSPNSDDRGIALGCLLHLLKPMSTLNSAFLGSEPYDKPNPKRLHTVDEIANMLSQGKIIGLIQGRAEHGARALGNRSILCTPGEGMKDKLNANVKNREAFRPFAAVCREEDAKEYFNTYGLHKWMTHNVTVKVDNIPAVTHNDGTCRLQTVTKQDNPFLWELLGHHKILLNTSFNIQGKPILNTYKDAIWMKENTGIDEVITNTHIL